MRVLDDLREINPDISFVCDPVLGDHGRLYCQGAVKFHRKILCESRDLTPNQFECELLTNIKIRTPEDSCRAARKLHDMGVKIVIIIA